MLTRTAFKILRKCKLGRGGDARGPGKRVCLVASNARSGAPCASCQGIAEYFRETGRLALCESMPVVLASAMLNADELAAVDSVLTQKQLSAGDLIDCIRMKIARKRGPRKQVAAFMPAMAGD